jgi:hypothetical protein
MFGMVELRMVGVVGALRLNMLMCAGSLQHCLPETQDVHKTADRQLKGKRSMCCCTCQGEQGGARACAAGAVNKGAAEMSKQIQKQPGHHASCVFLPAMHSWIRRCV